MLLSSLIWHLVTASALLHPLLHLSLSRRLFLETFGFHAHLCVSVVPYILGFFLGCNKNNFIIF